jgi:hypothetical protein
MINEEFKNGKQSHPLDIPVVIKRIELNAAEIAFTIKILQWNIDFAPEENSQNEIDLTTSILRKLIM